MSFVFAESSYRKLLLVVYGVSGLTALAYEVLWARMLAMQFGVSIFGVVVTISAFMAGLGLGSLVAAKRLRASPNPLAIFAGFESLIAILALSTPWLLLHLEELFVWIAASSSLSAWYLVQFLSVSVLLFIPAFCMGAGFPMMLRALGDTPETLARAYGVNTIGAALGALLPLFLLPQTGWLAAMQIISAVGLVVAIIAFVLSRLLPSTLMAANDNTTKLIKPKTAYLLAYAGIGAAALMLEVGWTRLFGMIMLRTEYVLALILALYLTGIGLGSVLSKYLKRRYWYTALPIAVSSFVLISLWFIPIVSNWIEYNTVNSLGEVLFQQAIVLTLLTFPITLILGAWLPLLNKLCGNNFYSGAWLYGSNSVGAAVGAVLAGFVFTPTLGTTATISLAALLVVALGLSWSNKKTAWLVLPLVVVAAYPVLEMPKVAEMLPKLYHNSNDLFHREDAINITHVIEQSDGQRLLLADLQRMDASSEPTAVEVQKNQARLPLLLHPNPESALFLGLGTGISAAGSLAFPNLQRTAVELSQGAIDAAAYWFAPVNNNVVEHMKIERDDARRFLMATNEKYDVIVGDLFHPDLVGRSALLSVQQFARVKRCLNSDGVFVQWLALNQFNIESFEIILRSFKQIFPDAVLFVDAFRVALVGGASKWQGAQAILDNLSRMNEAATLEASGGEGAWTWMGRFWGPVSVNSEGKVQDEWAPQIEYQLPRARYGGDLDLAVMLNYVLKRRLSVEDAAKALAVTTNDFEQFERAYAATQLAYKSWLAFLTNRKQDGEKMLQLAYQANPKDRWIGFAIADGALANLATLNTQSYDEKTVLESVLKIRPDHPEALTRLWLMEKRNGNREKAQHYKERLASISPFAKVLRKSD